MHNHHHKNQQGFHMHPLPRRKVEKLVQSSVSKYKNQTRSKDNLGNSKIKKQGINRTNKIVKHKMRAV